MILRQPFMLILLLVIPALFVVWYRRGLRFSAIVLMRVLVVLLIVLSLADPGVPQQQSSEGALIVLMDQSDSLTAAGKQQVQHDALRIAPLLQRPANDAENIPAQRVVPFWFGGHVVPAAQWDEPNISETTLDMVNKTLMPSASTIEDALRLARELAGTNSSVLLLSDGIQTSGDSVREAHALAARGVPVNVVPIQPTWYPDIRISSIRAPRSLHMGEMFDIHIGVAWHNTPDDTDTDTDVQNPPQQRNVTLTVWESSAGTNDVEKLIGTQEITIHPGNTLFTFSDTAETNGIIKLRAEVVVNTNDDVFPRNNSRFTTMMVAAAPRILLVQGDAGGADELSAALWPAIQTDIIAAEDIPTRLSDIRLYDGMILLNVSAYNLSLDQMTTVREFVRSEGHGLLITGGRQSYALGAYEGTPLEDVLPLSLTPPPRPNRSHVALLLIMDRSASMSIPIDVSKFDMAKEAAILSSEMLKSDDTIGILTFDTHLDWAVPFQKIGDGLSQKQIQDAIAMLDIGGGTDIYGALEEGVMKLLHQQASVRHVVILTDGRSFTNDEASYQQLMQLVRDNEITLSSIAIGIDSDTELLDNLATWGNGRYYFADRPADIPRLTIQESEIARSDPMTEGTFYAEVATPHALIRGFAAEDIPPITGYVATTPRDGATLVLQTPKKDNTPGDPLMATWQYGLGRVVAWTPTISAPWAPGWAAWDEYAPFWAQIIRYTLPRPDSGSLQVHFAPQQEGVQIVVDALAEGGTPIMADAIARITLPNGSTRDFSLHQTEPGRYTQLLVFPQEGAYIVQVLLKRNDDEYYTEVGYAYEVPAEYTPYHPSAPAGTSRNSAPHGIALLTHIADITGGQVLDEAAVQTLQTTVQATNHASEDTAPTMNIQQQPIWLWLLLMALVCWLLELALRRHANMMGK